VEEVELPEKADMIISEPMGFLLVHERMLESFISGRDRFLRPGGKMFPTTGTMFFSPFTDQALWDEQNSKLDFWDTSDFWGLDLRSLKEQARRDHFCQPVVGYFQPSILLCPATVRHVIDFASDSIESLKRFTVPFWFTIDRTAILHGIAGWFDVLFDGTSHKITLSTGPYTAGTHWYQCRFLLPDPLAVNRGQEVAGEMVFVANDKYSYNISLSISIVGVAGVDKSTDVSLADQYYAYYSGTEAGDAAAKPAVASSWATGEASADYDWAQSSSSTG
jgi:type I protein arginine methyltransferase